MTGSSVWSHAQIAFTTFRNNSLLKNEMSVNTAFYLRKFNLKKIHKKKGALQLPFFYY